MCVNLNSEPEADWTGQQNINV